jgi:hypothetical protein
LGELLLLLLKPGRDVQSASLQLEHPELFAYIIIIIIIISSSNTCCCLMESIEQVQR